MKKIIILFCIAVFFIPLFAADEGEADLQVRINQIIADFPNLEVYLSVFSKSSQMPITTLVRDNFTFYVDDKAFTPKLKTEVFLHTEAPISYYFVIDGSGVVVYDDDATKNQKQGVLNVINKIKKDQDYLSFFWISKEPQTVFTYETDADKMNSAVNKLNFDETGSPSFYDTVGTVFRTIEKESGKEGISKLIKRKAVFIISDGRDEASTDINTVEKFFNKISNNYPVYTIGITPLDDSYLYVLQDLSAKTGGNFANVGESYSKIPKTVDKYLDQILNSYVLKFKVSEINGDQKDHVLKIGITYEDEKVYFYKSFFADKPEINILGIIIIILIILLVIAGLVFLFMLLRKNVRTQMGISKRRCPVCKQRMKDDWDECLFCKYLPAKNKEKDDD